MKVEIVNRKPRKRTSIWIDDATELETEIDGISVYSEKLGWLCFHGEFKVYSYSDSFAIPSDSRFIVTSIEKISKFLKVKNVYMHFRN